MSKDVVILCPFHDERLPSMVVNRAEGVYHCFGCEASGDMLTLLEEIRYKESRHHRRPEAAA